MSRLSWVRRIWRQAPKPGSWFRTRETEADPEKGLRLRRWDAAQTHRLNRAHWQGVTGRTINLDLVEYLESLRTRIAHEVANNSDAEGVIVTHIADVVGDEGPLLQVQSDNPEYNARLEDLWKEWWAQPDITGELTGVDLLDLWIRSCWLNGEFLVQILVDENAPGPIKERLHNLAPRRLATPPGETGADQIILGVRRNKYGRPLGYSISNPPEQEYGVALTADDYEELKPQDILHQFIRLEAGQVRGVPWFATGLPVTADLRDYDTEVLDAARAAADYAVYLHTDHPDAAYLEVNESVPIERRTTSTLPPGWKAKSVQPTHPPTRYVEYRDEQLRKLGSPAAMPLMIVKRDSRKHNYSSARFDDRVYDRAIKRLRAWLARNTLNRLVGILARVGGMGENPILPPRPTRVRYKWNWPARPNVDQVKEDKAASERLKNETSCLRDECGAQGKPWDEILEQRAIERDKKRELGFLPQEESATKNLNEETNE